MKLPQLKYQDLPMEKKFKVQFNNNKYKTKSIVKNKKNFLNDKKDNGNVSNLLTEFNKIDRLFIFLKKKRKIQSKIYKRAFMTFLSNNFLNYLFLNKIFRLFFGFIKKFNKIKSSKEMLNFFISKLLLKNAYIYFYDDFLKLSYRYGDFLQNYFRTYFLALHSKKNLGLTKFPKYRKNKTSYFKKNNKRKNFRFFNMKSIVASDNRLYSKLFFFKRGKNFKYNMDSFKLKSIRSFLRKKKNKYYKLRFRRRWYSKKYLFMRRILQRNKNLFFYSESYYKLYHNFNKLKYVKKSLFKPKNFYQLKFLYKFRLNFFFKKIKSNLFFFFDLFFKNNTIFFQYHEKKFLSSLETYNYQLFLDYFYLRIFNYDFVSTKN